jgi:hypothetical protein
MSGSDPIARFQGSYPSRSDLIRSPLDQFLAPADWVLENFIRGVRNDSEISDARFVRLGVLRVLSQAHSGRDFLQLYHESFTRT